MIQLIMCSDRLYFEFSSTLLFVPVGVGAGAIVVICIALYSLLWWLYLSTKSIISRTQHLHISANNLTSKWKEQSLIMCHHLQKWPALSWLLVTNLWRESERRSVRVQIEQAHRLFCHRFNSANSTHILQGTYHCNTNRSVKHALIFEPDQNSAMPWKRERYIFSDMWIYLILLVHGPEGPGGFLL